MNNTAFRHPGALSLASRRDDAHSAITTQPRPFQVLSDKTVNLFTGKAGNVLQVDFHGRRQSKSVHRGSEDDDIIRTDIRSGFEVACRCGRVLFRYAFYPGDVYRVPFGR